MRSQIVDGKTGSFEDLNGKTIQDRIVLLDFNCGNRWLDISMLGAKAFIFIEPGDTTRVEAEKKYLNLPLNIPRYWISRKDGLYHVVSGREFENLYQLHKPFPIIAASLTATI